MSMLALTTAAMLLVASPGGASSSDASRIASNGGFLLGHAHRCGIPTDRVVRAGQLVRELILAAAPEARDQEDATARFAQFFLATAVPDQGDSKLVPSCRTVASEFEKLERHRVAGTGSNATNGRTTSRGFRLGDGE
ncbi:MAG TPA: hypothetical protein VEK82_12655 [Stellaceae bacterium]|nr:hypothetical protein [Stellaceae bacterium]